MFTTIHPIVHISLKTTNVKLMVALEDKPADHLINNDQHMVPVCQKQKARILFFSENHHFAQMFGSHIRQ